MAIEGPIHRATFRGERPGDTFSVHVYADGHLSLSSGGNWFYTPSEHQRRAIAGLMLRGLPVAAPSLTVVPAPGGVCDGSGLWAASWEAEDGRGERLAAPCEGCRACQ